MQVALLMYISTSSFTRHYASLNAEELQLWHDESGQLQELHPLPHIHLAGCGASFGEREFTHRPIASAG